MYTGSDIWTSVCDTESIKVMVEEELKGNNERSDAEPNTNVSKLAERF